MRIIRIIIVLLLGVLLFITVACEPAREEIDETGGEQLTSLSLLTLPAGTGSYAVAVPYVNYLKSNTDLNLFLQSVPSVLAIPPAISEGDSDIGYSLFPNVHWAFYGDQIFQERFNNLRILQVGEIWGASFISYKGTGIETIEDLKGKRVGYEFGEVSIILDETARAILHVYDIDEETIRSTPVDKLFGTLEDMINKKTDAGFENLKGASITEFTSVVEPVFLEISSEKAEMVAEIVPYMFPGETKGDVEGVPAGITVMCTPVVMYTRDDMPDDIAYKIVKTITEGQEELSTMHPDFAHWTFVYPLTVPYHEGAIQYFKEAGLWSQEIEEAHNDALKTIP